MVATIIGLNEDETEIEIIIKKYSGSILNSEPQFLAIGTIIKHPDYPNNIYVNTTAENFRLSNFEAALTANVIRPLNVNADWNASSGDALILNKPHIPTKVSDLTNDTGYITGYAEIDPIFTAWNKSTGISITKSQVI